MEYPFLFGGSSIKYINALHHNALLFLGYSFTYHTTYSIHRLCKWEDTTSIVKMFQNFIDSH